MSLPQVSVVIPTYQREQVLLESIGYLLKLRPGPSEIVVVDQTIKHDTGTERALTELDAEQRIRWVRVAHPSITHAMNIGLEHASNPIVLFVDDDIIPDTNLVGAHAGAHESTANIVAGQVLQPGEEPLTEPRNEGGFLFRSNHRQFVSELMGGNFSIKRDLALKLGGFDENFVHVAYRFEAEFASRALSAGERILFEPAASIRHLKAGKGGTRSYGEHLTTIRPSHSVGAYYFYIRSKRVPHRLWSILVRPFRAVRTRHHLLHPWWILPTLISEFLGFTWAVLLAMRGPRLIGANVKHAER